MDSSFVDAVVDAVNQAPSIENSTEGIASFAFVPKGYRVESLAQFQVDPARVRQTVTLLTAADFIAYWKRFAQPSSVVFGDERKATYTAVIDYHAADGAPQWTDHKAVYACPLSPEWLIWTAQDRKPKTQIEFARFIEDNLIDVIRPSSAEMLQVSLNLQSKKSATFSSSIRLSDGQTQYSYTEDIKNSAETKGGTLTVPEDFEIAVPVFLGGKSYAVTVRFRNRVEDGKLVLWYELVRPHKVVEAATRVVTEEIRVGIGAAADRMFLGAASGSC